MHFITATTLLFAACAAAQWDSGYQDWKDSQSRKPHKSWSHRWGSDSSYQPKQPPTDYRTSCTCQTNDQPDADLGRDACDQLSSIWSNLCWDEDDESCHDGNNVGLDPSGFGAACQRAAQSQNYNSYRPVNAEADCSPY